MIIMSALQLDSMASELELNSSSSGALTEDVSKKLMKAHRGAHKKAVKTRFTADDKAKKIKLAKQKRSQAQLTTAVSDSEDGSESSGDDDPKRELSRQVVKEAHWSLGDYPINEEKKLQRLATRGVVQLFNAVSKHQKSIEDKLKEVGPSERKKHKVLSSVDKGGFIDMLKGEQRAPDTTKKPVRESEPSWSILRDDYLKSSKLQDWDKDNESVNGHSDCEPNSNSD